MNKFVIPLCAAAFFSPGYAQAPAPPAVVQGAATPAAKAPAAPAPETRKSSMYIPPAFRETRPAVMHDLIRSHPLAILVTAGPNGLIASPIPFMVYPGDGQNGTLRAHMAKANPQWQDLKSGAECLVVFQGEQGYVAPAWYPSKPATHKVTPTWDYITVQAWGKPAVIEDSVWLRRLLDEQTRSQEQKRAHPWSPGDAPDGYIATLMKTMVGVEIPIARMEGKWKLSQNRDETDLKGVISGMNAADDPHQNPALAGVIEARHKEAAKQ